MKNFQKKMCSDKTENISEFVKYGKAVEKKYQRQYQNSFSFQNLIVFF